MNNKKILFCIILAVAFFGSNSCYAKNKCLDVDNEITYCIMPNGDKCYIYKQQLSWGGGGTYNFGFSCIAK